MLHDSIANWNKHFVNSPAWREIGRIISGLNSDSPDGKTPVIGDDAFIGVSSYQSRKLADGKIEAHQRYIDVQLLLDGKEEIHVFNTGDLKPEMEYDPARDLIFLSRENSKPTIFTMSPGSFLILNPEDAHMPCIAIDDKCSAIKKVVVKIRTGLLD